MAPIPRKGIAPPPLPPRGPGEDDADLEEFLEGLTTTIRIVGCGGGGCNTINRLAAEGIPGITLIAANTDAQHLLMIHATHKVLLGRRTTRGRGAGALPEIGHQSALESAEQLTALIRGTDLLFLTCGLGGGTGTGSIPVVAKLAKDLGILTLAVVTLPFGAEGAARMRNAERGLEELRQHADTVIVVPNDGLLALVPKLPVEAAFKVADEVLMRSIKGITEIITRPGLVNLDFSDIRTILKGGGVALIGMGEGSGEGRAHEAVEEALHSPLVEVDTSAALGALVKVSGGPDMSLAEAEQVVEDIAKAIAPEARIIWGASVDMALERTLRVMVVLTGVESRQILGRTSKRVRRKLRGDGVDQVG